MSCFTCSGLVAAVVGAATARATDDVWGQRQGAITPLAEELPSPRDVLSDELPWVRDVLRRNVTATNILMETTLEELCGNSQNSVYRTDLESADEVREMNDKGDVQVICYEYGSNENTELARDGYRVMLSDSFFPANNKSIVLVGIFGDSTEIESQSMTGGFNSQLKDYRVPRCREHVDPGLDAQCIVESVTDTEPPEIARSWEDLWVGAAAEVQCRAIYAHSVRVLPQLTAPPPYSHRPPPLGDTDRPLTLTLAQGHSAAAAI
jgi:hypothetical protein